ncbi:MAG: homogentisate 1,2-dioxygenase [Deltaproteobacteria bacterium]|nr:homogentisate 1,2-dioxygenase [Deltaproteobacteria bacterium]
MIIKKGKLPATPHTEFYAIPGVLALEMIHGSYGFSGPWSRKMHVRSYPTEQVKAPVKADFNFALQAPKESEVLQPYHILTGEMPYGGDALRARKPIVFGPRTVMSIIKPTAGFSENEYFRNGEMHEIYYVQNGTGTLHSEYGSLPFQPEDYIVVPKGTTYSIDLASKQAWFMLTESVHPITFPQHYFNKGGQATLMSPVVETEIITPELFAPRDERGDFTIFVKHNGGKVTKTTLGHHPFDVCGWEGALYPFVFPIKNHHGIAREIHTAPPVHQTFQAGNVPNNGFSLCSFVPQMEGWHPKDIPAPYGHFNVDSDECMFFCNVSYGARKGVIQEGSFTFHPGSTPHSPQGHAALKSTASRGKISARLAVMLDTYFESLTITTEGFKYCDKEYPLSWDDAKWESPTNETWEAESPTE